MRALQLKYKQKQQELSYLKTYIKKNSQDDAQMRSFVSSMRQNGEVLRQISDFNEMMRRRCQHELHDSNSRIDSYQNKIFELNQNKQIYMMKYEVLEEQFKLLFQSIETISNAKNLEDKFDVEIAV